MREITHIVVHTAAAASGGKAVDQEPENVLGYWQRKGWRKPGYHKYIRFDGRIHEFSLDHLETNGVLGFNRTALHICCAGHGDVQDFTDAQKSALVKQIVRWLKIYGLTEKFKQNPMRVLGHRETRILVKPIYRTNKSCPGSKVSMTTVRQLVLAELGK